MVLPMDTVMIMAIMVMAGTAMMIIMQNQVFTNRRPS